MTNMKEKVFPYLLLFPYLAIFVVFLAYPIVRGVYMSFWDWGIFGPRAFLGWSNYFNLFANEAFINALKNTLFYTAMNVPMVVVVSLLLAVLLQKYIPGISAFKTAFFLPIAINLAVAAVAVGWMLDAQTGILNRLLLLVGLPRQSWLNQEGWAMFAVNLVAVWSAAGVNIIIFLAGLENISQELYDAAMVDGANALHKLVHITLPLLKPVTLLVTILSIVGALQAFGEIYMLTGGGPYGTTTTLTYLLYEQGFTHFRFGTAAAIGVIMTILIAVLSFIQFKLFRQN